MVIFIRGTEAYIARILFENCIHKYKGQSFEDFFISVMSKADSGFQAVKAYGNIGDRKNDGFNQKTGVYYQVFAPEDIGKGKTIADGVKKLEGDFAILYAHWNDICPIKHFYFVINDKYEGIPAPIVEKAIELNKSSAYPGTSVEVFTAKDLEKIFTQLDDAQKYDVVGYFPSEDMSILEYSALQETISYLLSIEFPQDFSDNLVVPDFDDKILFNGLSKAISNRLTTGSYQEGLLLHYFNESPGTNEVLQKKFHGLYEQAKEAINANQANFSDKRFFYILEQACVKKTLPIQTSVLVLMAHYFASCDIFEEPQ